MSLPTNCLRPECRRYIPAQKGKQRKWCSEECSKWGQLHRDVARREPCLNLLNETSLSETQVVVDFLVACKSSAQIARENETTPEYVASVLRRMGVHHPELQRSFDIPPRLLRDLAAA